MPLVSVIHDASASPAPAQAGNAPQKFARSTRFQNSLSFGKRSSGLLPAISAALMAPIEVPFDSRLMQRLIDSALVGAECPAALQHEHGLTVIVAAHLVDGFERRQSLFPGHR